MLVQSRVAALTGAAAAGNDKVVRSVLIGGRTDGSGRTDGITVDTRERSSQKTALHYAILNDRLSTVELLLELGADLTTADVSGQTCLHLCVGLRRSAILRCIIAAASARGLLDDVLRARDRLGRAPHHLAAARGDRAELSLLLDAAERSGDGKSLLDAPDEQGNTALRLAATQACRVTGPTHEKMLATMDALLRRGADPNVKDAAAGETLLGWCARSNLPSMIRKLLRDFDGTYGPRADPSIPDRSFRRTPLDWCALQDAPVAGEEGPPPFRPECAIALVEGGAAVADRHARLLVKARTLPSLPRAEAEHEKSVAMLHARLRTAYSVLDDAVAADLKGEMLAHDARGSGTLGLLEFHAALRRVLRIRPSQCNDHDVGTVFKYLTQERPDKRIDVDEFVAWLHSSRFRAVARGVMATRRFTTCLMDRGGLAGYGGTSAPGSVQTSEAGSAAGEAAARAVETFSVGDTIGAMSWGRPGHSRTQEHLAHLHLNAPPKRRLKPLAVGRKTGRGKTTGGRRGPAAPGDASSLPGDFDEASFLSLRSLPAHL